MLLKQGNGRRVKVRISALIAVAIDANLNPSFLIERLHRVLLWMQRVTAGARHFGHMDIMRPERFCSCSGRWQDIQTLFCCSTVYIGSLKRITSFTPSRCLGDG